MSDIFAVMALLAIAALLVNYVLFAGSSELADPLGDQSVEKGQRSSPPASDG